MSQSPIPDAPDQGDLAIVSVPLLLTQAWRDERTASLEIESGPQSLRIDVREGGPVAIVAPAAADAFGRYLEYAGKISEEQRIEVERVANERACPQAAATRALGLLDVKTLYTCMRADTRRRIAETFAWKSGRYVWRDSPGEAEEGAAPAKAFDLLSILQQQLPKQWSTDRLFSELSILQDMVGDISPRFRKIAHKLGRAGEPANRAIVALDGHRSLGQVLGECAGDPLAAATLWTVVYSGVLRVNENAKRASEAPALDFEFEVQVTGAPKPSVDVGAASNKGKSGKTSERDSGDELRGEIEALLPRLAELDHYGALGLEEDASSGQIKKAYFKAAKKYHPDALARIGLDDVKEAAAQVFARIAEAFETLSDADKRRAYDAGGSDEPEIDTARLAQAETSFRKGEILAKMGNFDGALEYFEPAVELWPEEPAYQAGLGWALYKQSKADLPRAIAHLEIALEQAPKDAVTLLHMGLVMRAAGDNNLANEFTARARAIDPYVED